MCQVAYIEPMYGENGSPTAGRKYEIQIEVAGLQWTVEARTASQTLVELEQVNKWSKHKIREFLKKVLCKEVRDKLMTDQCDQKPVEVGEDILRRAVAEQIALEQETKRYGQGKV